MERPQHHAGLEQKEIRLLRVLGIHNGQTFLLSGGHVACYLNRIRSLATCKRATTVFCVQRLSALLTLAPFIGTSQALINERQEDRVEGLQQRRCTSDAILEQQVCKATNENQLVTAVLGIRDLLRRHR
jgi:hypothetical protein